MMWCFLFNLLFLISDIQSATTTPNPCPANQTYDPCPSPCPGENSCFTAINGISPSCPPPTATNQPCRPVCKCSPGYVRRGQFGPCIRPNDCCDDPNAVIVSCPNPCPGGTCENPEFTKCGLACKSKGCQCASGYVKDSSGKCVTLAMCPKPSCGTNEVWNPCSNFCSSEDTCTTLLRGTTSTCTSPPPNSQCTGKCECKPGYVRDYGACQLPSVCCTTPGTEIKKCPNPCPGGTCDQLNYLPCNATCKPYGCVCKFGYFRSFGQCVPLNQCPKPCKTNEIWYSCPKYCFSDDTCASLESGKAPVCPPAPSNWQCSGQCVCQSNGFVRENGTCLQRSVCCSDPNAEFVKCPNPCPGGTCLQPNHTSCTTACKPYGCQCKPGFVKDSTGSCIPLTQCPKPCKTNEVWVPCPEYCSSEDTCANLMKIAPECTPRPPNVECTGKCLCKTGFVRENGTCAPQSVCCSDPNAEFVKYPNPCPGGTCIQPNFTDCKVASLAYGCQCKKGFVKDNNGKCILLAECPVACSANQTWVPCPSPCPPEPTCSATISGILPSCTTPSFSQTCKPACRCNSGYVRKSFSEGCIRPNDCCGDPNAEIVTCPNPCPGGTCENPEFTKCGIPCKSKGCQCKKGFVKDQNGKCIPLSLCIKPCKPNEVWTPCPEYCSSEDTCANLMKITPPCTPRPPNWQCTGKCWCKTGFVRENGTCAPQSVCCSDPNAEFVKYPNPCPGGTCIQPNFTDCKVASLAYGCQCKKGFVKENNGKCILLAECPIACPANQTWVPCPSPCPPEPTCSATISGILPSCTTPSFSQTCKPACRCNSGYVRKSFSEGCIIPNDCCGDPNAEIVTCPNPCPGGTCDIPEFTKCSIPCKSKGCQCKKGFVKDQNGKCIPLSLCIKPCPKNEVWNACPRYCTSDDTCAKLLFGILPDCPPPTSSQCIGRCECNPGLVRKNGTCTDPSVCCKDPNAEFVKCPNPCPGGTCDQPNFTPCKMACKPYGCQCKKGFVKNPAGKCVTVSKCPNKCGANEVWNPCVPYCTFDMTCERLIDGVIRDCARQPPDWQCSGGCQCADGLVRIDGKCVQKSACCPDPNSELVSCPNPCPGGTCVSPSNDSCKMACKKWGCQCNAGYLLNYKSECIPAGTCPRCGLNQHFDCGPSEDKSCAKLDVEPDPYGECVERCYCNEGYARNSQNACIPISDCNLKPTVTPKTTTPWDEYEVV